jgi:hypothetical protein
LLRAKTSIKTIGPAGAPMAMRHRHRHRHLAEVTAAIDRKHTENRVDRWRHAQRPRKWLRPPAPATGRVLSYVV